MIPDRSYAVAYDKLYIDDYRDLGGDVEREWRTTSLGFNNIDDAIRHFRMLVTDESVDKVELSAW